MTSVTRNICEFIKRRFFLISWISFVTYLFYNTFLFYSEGRQFYYLRNILGLGLCISRGTASVLNLCCALVLLPLCKKLNLVLYRVLSEVWPGLFFFWLEMAKSFHMTVAITLLVFAVVHSISHFINLWNFSRGYDEGKKEINLARYKNESPFILLLSQAGLTGISMLVIITCMGLTTMRPLRRRLYNLFWYTHQLYLVFLALLIVHPLSGVLKEEVLNDDDASLYPSQSESFGLSANSTNHTFISIKSMTWAWMAFPLSCFFVDLLWRIFSRNLAKVTISEVCHMPGRTMALTLSCPHDQFRCRMGQYVLLQCQDISLLEWHPFTVVRLPTSSQRHFVIWIRVKGDWTESLESLLQTRGSNGINILVDGPLSSPMELAGHVEVSLCVAAGVGITPFVCLLHHISKNPRSKLPGRIHLIWIVRHEEEITWLAELANKTITQLRNANRPDRLHLEFYVTNTSKNRLKLANNKDQNDVSHMVIINEKGRLCHVIRKDDKNIVDDEKATLLTPNVKRHLFNVKESRHKVEESDYELAKEYPILGCRLKRGRPHWDKVFGYWVHLYPQQHLNVYCCGPKKLVKTLRRKCKHISITTKNRFSFIYEGFS